MASKLGAYKVYVYDRVFFISYYSAPPYVNTATSRICERFKLKELKPIFIPPEKIF